MKNIKSSRIFNLCLLVLAANFLIINNPIISKAQTESTVPKLEGTLWQMEALPYVGVQAIYFEFRTEGKVLFTEVKSSTILPQSPPHISSGAGGLVYYPDLGSGIGGLDAPRTKALPLPPITTEPTSETEIGTYTISGNVIRMKFADFSVKATLKGNLIEGQGTSKNTNDKMKFLITRVVKDRP